MAVCLLVASLIPWVNLGAPFYTEKDNLPVYQDSAGATHAVASIADWEIRRAHTIENMKEVMGEFPVAPPPANPDFRVEEEWDEGTYTRKKVSFSVEEGDRLPAYLLIPKDLAGPAPAMLCLHPTSEHGKKIVINEEFKPNRLYAQELAQRGYVTLAPDYPGFGDYVEARKALYERGYASATMKGIWNHMRCVDLLQSLPEVDGDRIGCIGHSLGGHNTLFLGVFDPRVKVMVTSCGFTSFPKYYGGNLTGWSHDGYMPRIASQYGTDPARMPFDFPEILGALAPRAVFINAPLHDGNFEVSGVRACVTSAAAIFSLFGVEGNLEAVYPDAEHDFPDEARAKAYAFVDHALGQTPR